MRSSFRSLFVVAVAAAVLAGGTVAAADLEAGFGSDRPHAGTVLRLGGLSFDPALGPPELPEGWARSATSEPDLHIIQFAGRVSDDALDALRKAGLEPVQYIHPNSYVVWGRASARNGLTLGGRVRWSGDFAPAYRVQPQWRDLDTPSLDVKALIYRGADVDRVIDRVVALGGVETSRRVVHEELEVAGFMLPGALMQAVASVPGVYSIQVQSTDAGSRAEASSQISAGNVDGGNLAFPGYRGWLAGLRAGLGLDGTGVVIASVDEGVDQTHPDLASRMLPCVGDSCGGPLRLPHGTHTAGTMVGDGTLAVVDASGFERGLGVAPGAMIFEQAWRLMFRDPGGMLQLMTESSRNGAQISNNSWGSATAARGYDIDTLLVDAGVRDADPDAFGSQALVYVQAIANGEGGVSSQGTPDDGKNIFTIGSTPGLVAEATPASNIDDLSDNSGHGPALDGRTIPHMVAPGCYVDAPFQQTGETEWNHNFLCGTSMATAHVSGAIALFFEYYRALAGSPGDPSPALVKAAFLPVAHDLEGNVDADGAVMGHRPDSKQGWGRLDLAAILDPADAVLYFDEPKIFDFTGQEWSRVVTPANPAAPVRVMLVWTDAPGHGLGGTTPAWNNDLDLTVEAGGQTYLGNDFGVDGFSTTGGVPDGMNNAEGVILPTVSGNATIRVNAVDINSNGVPHVGDFTDQDFALVCYNCVLVPDFALAVDLANVGVCAPSSSDLQVDVSQLAGFGDPVTLSAVGLPAGSIATFSENPVAPPGGSVMTIDPGTAVDGDYTVEVHGDSAALNRSISLVVRLRTASPGLANLTAPLDAAIDVAPRPVLEWDAISGVDRYMVEVSTAPDFLELNYSGIEAGTSHTLGIILRQDVTYYWRVRATNACGYGVTSATFSFTTIDIPDLLLVDDDYDLPNEQPEYTQVLDNLGVAYDVYDVWVDHVFDEPDLETLSGYEQIIWFSGQEEVYAGPNNESERILPTWLDGGGCMLITSLDYLNAQGGVTPFMQERLGVGSVVEDTGQSTVTGAGSVYGALPLMPLANLNPDYRDVISPDLTAELAFAGDLGDAGIDKDGASYRTSFLGFGVESAGTGSKGPILDAFLTWCDGLPAVDGDLDGVLNGDDCAPSDPNSWGIPQPITDLTLGKGAIGFSWSEPVGGGGSTYDVLRSDDPTDFLNATCVAAGSTRREAPPDTAEPASGELLFYLVGARNGCGVSTLGENLDLTPRYGTACDPEQPWW